MKITWNTSLVHNVCVDVPGGENMTRDELMEAIADEECSYLWVESPCLNEILATAQTDLFENQFDIDNTEYTEKEQKALESGKPHLSEYS